MAGVAETLEQFFQRAKLPLLFAGAGVSAQAGLPTWSSYLSKLAAAVHEYDPYTRLQMDEAIRDGVLTDAASYYEMCRKLPASTKLSLLVEPLKEYDQLKLVPLVRLPFQAIATTNFDRALLHAYALAHQRPASEVNIDDPTLMGATFSEQFYLARIHGRVEVPSSMRLSRERLEALLADKSYLQYLGHIFTSRQVLFVGFSFLDPAINAVLKSIKLATGSMHGQEHLALVPADASAEFINALEDHSIRRVKYSSDNFHRELWEGISSFSESLVERRPSGNTQSAPFKAARKYLATAYARTKFGGKKGPLAVAIAEGVVSGMIANAGTQGVSEEALVVGLISEIAISEASAAELVSRSVSSLFSAGICRQVSSSDLFFANGNTEDHYGEAINRLVDGAVNRFVLRERGVDSAQIRLFLNKFFNKILLLRGWDLGAAYASNNVPEDVDVRDVMDGMRRGGVGDVEVGRLARSVNDLFMRPDDEEAALLADLGRMAFALELFIESPHDGFFLQRTLPEIIYLDANVIMPAITIGHPHHNIFSKTVRALQEAAKKASIKISIRICKGFLNEVVSHRRLAEDAMSENNGEGAIWAEREVGLIGSSNVNVFIGSFFNFRSSFPKTNFAQFLEKYAPYRNEVELRKYLLRLGFEVVNDDNEPKVGHADILHLLEVYYGDKLERQKKSGKVIAHDAAQLAILNSDVSKGFRSVFVSADRGLRAALGDNRFSHLSNSIIAHVGLAQLVDLLIGQVSTPREMTSLLWGARVSSETDRIREYLIGLALREHNAAVAMAMSDVVGAIAEDAAMEVEKRRISLDADSRHDKEILNRMLEGYESNFFQKMNLEIERQKRLDSLRD